MLIHLEGIKEKSLNLTLVLENSWNLKNGPFVLDFGTNVLENDMTGLYLWNGQKELEILDIREPGATSYLDSIFCWCNIIF